MEYGLENYEYQNIYKTVELTPVKILEGQPPGDRLDPYAEVSVEVEMREREEDKNGESEETPGELNFLLSMQDEVKIDVTYSGEIKAPVEKGRKVGRVVYHLNDEPVKQYDLVLKDSVKRKDWRYMGKYVWQEFLLTA